MPVLTREKAVGVELVKMARPPALCDVEMLVKFKSGGCFNGAEVVRN